jgi:hypothetical protein
MANARKPNEPLPPLLNEIAELIGREAALKLAGAVGGTRIFIPKRKIPNHWLIKLLGQDAADTLAERFGGTRFDFPLGPHATQNNMRARIVALNDLKLSVNEIALSLHVTERTVWRHLSRLRATTKTTTITRTHIPA